MTESPTDATPDKTEEANAKTSRRENEAQAAALLLRGASGEEISAAIGTSSHLGGIRAAERGLARSLQSTPEASRALDVTRANTAIAALWPRVEAGQPEAAAALAALLTVRAELLGLTGGPAVAEDEESSVAESAPKRGGRSRGKTGDTDQLSLDA